MKKIVLVFALVLICIQVIKAEHNLHENKMVNENTTEKTELTRNI